MTILAFLVTVIYIPGLLGISIQPGWALLSCTLPIASWRGRSLLPAPLQILGVAFIGYALLSLWWSPNVFFGINALWQQGCIVFAFIAGAQLAKTDGVLKALAIGVSISSLLAIVQDFGYSPIAIYQPGRSGGLLFNPIVLSQACAFLIIWLATKKLWWFIPTLIPGVYFAHTRSGPLILVLVALCWLLRYSWWFSLGFIAAVGYTVRTVMLSGTEDAWRLALWVQTIKHLSWLGAGAGAMDSVYLHTSIGLVSPEFAHNEFLDLAYQYGLAAAIPIMVALWTLRKDNDSEFWVIFAFFISALFSFPLHSPVTAFIAAVCLGHMYRYRNLAWTDFRYRRYGFVDWGLKTGRKVSGFGRANLSLQQSSSHA